MSVDVIATPFPVPPGAIIRVLNMFQILRRGDADEIRAAGIDGDVPRPWDPASCPAELREDVWVWCDDVAAWINHEYAWRPSHMIPPCWPQHAHIARELAVLAFLRWAAESATGPEAVEDWHRYTLPMFFDRMTSRLGESTCRTGDHAVWPAESRNHSYFADRSADGRRQTFQRDAARVDTTESAPRGRRSTSCSNARR